MILRFARHGQPALGELPPGVDHELPPGDFPLSALGRKQAEFLGRHLKAIGFSGKIISSPYARTAETADVVSQSCGIPFYLEPRLQEMRFYPEPPCPGLTLAQLRAFYAGVALDAVLAYPWLTPGGVEELDAVRHRVDGYVEELVKHFDGGEVLLVGHGASIQSLKWNLFARSGYDGADRHNWNCSLSSFEVFSDGSAKLLELARYDFIPEEFVTSNLRKFGDPACV